MDCLFFLHVLTITGTGKMPDYSTGTAPWYAQRDNIKTLVISSGVTKIGNSAFENCGSITGNLTIPNSVTSIGKFAFRGCSGFTGNLTIPSSATSIGSFAFSYCKGFTGNLTIPNAVTSIGNYAFDDCSGFTSVTALSATPVDINANVFDNVDISKIILYVPSDSVSLYQAAKVWKKFGSIKPKM